MEKCQVCQFYDRQNVKPNDGKAATQWGQCRREAPMLHPINAKSYMIEGVWPHVRDDDWCGEWKLATRRTDSRITEVTTAPHVQACHPDVAIAVDVAVDVVDAAARCAAVDAVVDRRQPVDNASSRHCPGRRRPRRLTAREAVHPQQELAPTHIQDTLFPRRSACCGAAGCKELAPPGPVRSFASQHTDLR